MLWVASVGSVAIHVLFRCFHCGKNNQHTYMCIELPVYLYSGVLLHVD